MSAVMTWASDHPALAEWLIVFVFLRACATVVIIIWWFWFRKDEPQPEPRHGEPAMAAGPAPARPLPPELAGIPVAAPPGWADYGTAPEAPAAARRSPEHPGIVRPEREPAAVPPPVPSGLAAYGAALEAAQAQWEAAEAAALAEAEAWRAELRAEAEATSPWQPRAPLSSYLSDDTLARGIPVRILREAVEEYGRQLEAQR